MELLRTLKFIANHPLNRGNKIGSLLRFVRWQVCARLWDGALETDFVNNTRLLVARGMVGATGNVYTGLHEFEDMAFVLHFLRKGEGFVDVGANVGSYTILAGGAIGARCISIEPIPATFAHLMDNINLNGIGPSVAALNVGAGSESGVLRFTSELDTVNHVATDREKNVGTTIEVPVRRLDEVLGNFEPLLIKIDVEGFETNVIAGAERALSRESLLGVIMELNGSGSRYGFDEEKLHATMLDYGFRAFIYAPFGRELVRIDGKNMKPGNTLYLRNADEAASRLKTAPAFSTGNGRKI